MSLILDREEEAPPSLIESMISPPLIRPPGWVDPRPERQKARDRRDRLRLHVFATTYPGTLWELDGGPICGPAAEPGLIRRLVNLIGGFLVVAVAGIVIFAGVTKLFAFALPWAVR